MASLRTDVASELEESASGASAALGLAAAPSERVPCAASAVMLNRSEGVNTAHCVLPVLELSRSAPSGVPSNKSGGGIPVQFPCKF